MTLDHLKSLPMRMRPYWIMALFSIAIGAKGTNAAPSPVDSTAARLGVRLAELETELQGLQGTLEELQHQIQGMKEHQERQNVDAETRFKNLEDRLEHLHKSSASKKSEKSEPSSTSSPKKTAEKSPPSAQKEEVSPTESPSTERTFNDQLQDQASDRPKNLRPPSSTAPSASKPLKDHKDKGKDEHAILEDFETPKSSPKTPQDLFKSAKMAFEQGDYKASEEIFQRLIQKHPQDKIIPQAKYYLGSIYYIQEDFTQASLALVQAYKADPKGAKAQECLLKLALSLKQLSKKAEACKALDKLYQAFPKMNLPVKKQADQLRKKLHCSSGVKETTPS